MSVSLARIDETVQVILIVVITGLATISVVSGLDKGIRILSELNLGLAVLLLALVLCLGPTVLLLKSFVENTGGYLSELVSKTFNLYAYEPKSSNWGKLLGLVVGAVAFFCFIYGFTEGFPKMQVKRITIYVPNLPKSFAKKKHLNA